MNNNAECSSELQEEEQAKQPFKSGDVVFVTHWNRIGWVTSLQPFVFEEKECVFVQLQDLHHPGYGDGTHLTVAITNITKMDKPRWGHCSWEEQDQMIQRKGL